MKKILLFLLCINLFIPSVHASTDTAYEYVLMDMDSGRVLASKNKDSPRLIASITKIMTAIIAIENSNLTDIVHISKKAANTGGSTLGIQADTNITMESLLYGLLLRSGNDCAVAIAEHIGGSIDNFSKMMNDKAKHLRLDNSNFITPHGLDDINHYTTAYDLAILTDYALKNDTFLRIVNTKNIDIKIGSEVRNISNTNELLRKC
jgi:D-alanyl-D-alanine carboxypeptidase